MIIGDIPLFQAITAKMRWHQARQGVLAENIANADTPNFRGRDLKDLNFSDQLRAVRVGGVETARTHRAHFAGKPISSVGDFDARKQRDFEVTPDGNEVVLEEQMMKVAGNQMDYQAATSLYTKSLGLIKTAMGRRG